MYVCQCRRVTDVCVRAAVAAGARDLDTIRRLCGASARCGGCRPVVEAILVAAGVTDLDDCVTEPAPIDSMNRRRVNDGANDGVSS
jgi:bacterioferritin-associated ferredoxin